MSVKELKGYIRTHGLHKALIPLSQKKASLISDLKKHGHWDDSISKAKPTAKPKPKPKEKLNPLLASVRAKKERKKKEMYDGVKKKSNKERKPPPKLPGLEWKIIHDGKLPDFIVSPNFWEWSAKNVPSIKDVGKLTDYSYVADVSKKDDGSTDYHREGRIYDESTGNHLQYSVPEFKKKWRAFLKKQEKVVEKKADDSIVEVELGNPKSVKKGVKKLTESLQAKAMKDLDKITKEFTLANAKKELKKSKVDFLKFLDKSNKESKKINDMIAIFNKGIQADAITLGEFKAFQRKVKQHQTTQRKIGGVFKNAFDSNAELDEALKKAGIKSLKR